MGLITTDPVDWYALLFLLDLSLNTHVEMRFKSQIKNVSTFASRCPLLLSDARV